MTEPDSSDRVTFKCNQCGHTVSIDEGNPPSDDDILSCLGCGHQFGIYAKVKEAMVAAAKGVINKIVSRTFGKPPTWTEG
jgi:hypothetical protein